MTTNVHTVGVTYLDFQAFWDAHCKRVEKENSVSTAQLSVDPRFKAIEDRAWQLMDLWDVSGEKPFEQFEITKLDAKPEDTPVKGRITCVEVVKDRPLTVALHLTTHASKILTIKENGQVDCEDIRPETVRIEQDNIEKISLLREPFHSHRTMYLLETASGVEPIILVPKARKTLNVDQLSIDLPAISESSPSLGAGVVSPVAGTLSPMPLNTGCWV